MFEKVHALRLLKVADYLENNQLTHKKFDLGAYREPIRDFIGRNCGTVGCIVGDCHNIFKGEWRLMPEADTWVFAQWFFGITEKEYIRLFTPAENKKALDAGGLPRYCTPQQAAENIRKFVQEKLEVDSVARKEVVEAIKDSAKAI